jgi:hypothetical protein
MHYIVRNPRYINTVPIHYIISLTKYILADIYASRDPAGFYIVGPVPHAPELEMKRFSYPIHLNNYNISRENMPTII